MKKFVDFDETVERFGCDYVAQGEDFDLAGRIGEHFVEFVRKRQLRVMDVRTYDARNYGDDYTWVRFEHANGLKVIIAWDSKPEIVCWTLTSDDTGSLTDGRDRHGKREIDYNRRIRQVDEVAAALNEKCLCRSIANLRLDLLPFESDFVTTLFENGSRRIAGLLSNIDQDRDYGRAGMREDDPDEVNVRKYRELLFVAALCGDVVAMRELAWRFDSLNDSTKGIRKDDELAAYWYEKAARRGDGVAANNLAYIYVHSDMGRHDCDQAIFWYKKAAERGIPEAKRGLAQCMECRMRGQNSDEEKQKDEIQEL